MSNTESPQKKELIDVVEPIPVQHRDHASSNKVSESGIKGTHVWASLTTLLLLVILVIFLLPEAVDQYQSSHDSSQELSQESEVVQKPIPKPQEIDAEQLSSQQESPEELNNHLAAKAEVEAQLARLISLENLLKQHTVNQWAPEDYAKALEQGRLGDEYFRKRQYAQAGEQFENAIAGLEALEQRIQPTLEQALTRGEQALAQADEVAATRQFELALAIDSENLRATHGLQRASTIKQLFAILQTASSFESHGQLQQAKSKYQEAATLDPLSEEALSSMARVESKLNDQAFEEAIANGYRALSNRQYSDARAAFNTANTIKPNSKQASTGLSKVNQAIRDEKIENLLYEANHFSEFQQWPQAVSSYEKVLELDSQNLTAQQGLKTNQAKAEIQKDLEVALESTNFLYKNDVLERAEHLLLRIENLESPGSNIENQYTELSQQVDIATTPISIMLESDGNTEVTLYKVARLGMFAKHQLELRPGPYTIVGTRIGYRDERIDFQVSPESSGSSIYISCDEPI